ncbi:MAG: efflux RND transporter periplasmic adaptor subunit [bacterium]|nr:efflux RND transporter periplasmic adaptor subunit [bacterium]
MKIKTILMVVILVAGGFIAGQFINIPGLFTGGQHEDEAHVHVTTDEKGEKQLYTCGMHPNVIQEGPGDCPICGMKLTPIRSSEDTESSEKPKEERKILYWVAPMDPGYIRDEPGKSPMGMDLVPVYEDEVAGGSVITINPNVVQNMGVRTGVVEQGPLSRVIRTAGHVDYDETRLAVINTKISGWIEKVHVQKTGAHVQKGQSLYDIYSPELVAAQQEFLLSLESGSPTIQKAVRKRLEFWDIPKSEIQSLIRSRTVRKTLTINSRFSGIVVHLNAVEGMFFKQGSDLFRIADFSTVWVYAHIYENEVPYIKEGQTAFITLSYLPGKTYRGTVDYIYPYLDKKTRDIKVRLIFSNPDLELKPEMYANVKIESTISDKAIVIPAESIIHSGERTIVFVVKGEGKFQPREVEIGPEDDKGRTQILSGLAPGETIVVSGQFLLDSESKLREAIRKMLDAQSGKPSEHEEMEEMEGMEERGKGSG